MTSEALAAPLSELPQGEARFIRPSEAKSLILTSERDEYITVDVPEVRTGIRGRLAWLFEEAIERSLELRGACSPGIGASASLENSLADQLYRARLIGARGLTIPLPTLEGITNRKGALDADDSATLHWWIESTRHRPIRLYLDVNDCMFGAYLEPVTLTQLLHTALPKEREDSPPVVVEWVDSAQTNQADTESESPPALPESIAASPISDVVASARCSQLGIASAPRELEASPDSVNTDVLLEESLPTETTNAPLSMVPVPAPLSMVPTNGSLSFAPTLVPPPDCVPIDADAIVAIVDRDDAQRTTLVEPPEDSDVALTPLVAPATDAAQHTPIELSAAPASAPIAVPHEPDPSLVDAVVAETAHREPSALRSASAERLMAKLRINHDLILPVPHPPTMPAPAAPLVEPVAATEESSDLPLHVDAKNAWRSWMQRLDAARGPKPLNAIEQLFINAYVPLMDAYQRGIAGPECRSVLDHWAASFAKSYSEAFDALRHRGRRPMMVLDIPEAAQRLARLHGARSVQLVLVDGLRFDLGLRVESRLVAKLGQVATLTDRFLLWSALPTNTSQQLELIARGADGLRDGDVHSETPVVVARGRAASTLRRVRAGGREILKLDLVEARLGEPGGPLAARLDQLSEEVADSLAIALGRLPPRTLVAIFGDHGFCLDPHDHGTAAMRAGGASPEEVLVPGFAWLVGQTH